MLQPQLLDVLVMVHMLVALFELTNNPLLVSFVPMPIVGSAVEVIVKPPSTAVNFQVMSVVGLVMMLPVRIVEEGSVVEVGAVDPAFVFGR